MGLRQRSGWIEVITGPMFAGKTEELLRRINRLQYAKKRIVVFKPVIDNRFAEGEVVSHDKNSIRSVNINHIDEIFDYVKVETDVIAIDEVQFLQPQTVRVLEALADKGKCVIVSGLDMDFRGEPFSFMPELLAMAEQVTKLTAVCLECGALATRTQRIIDGKPAKYMDPVVMIGASESYEARCRKCHKVYRKPKRMVG